MHELNVQIKNKIQPITMVLELIAQKKIVSDEILSTARANLKELTNQYIKLEKQLIQAEKLATVGTLTGGVAHEINNPLSAILINVQMLLNDHENQPVDKESLSLIEEATKRCKTILQKLMTYQKCPTESETFVGVDLLKTLKKTLTFLKFQLKQDKINVIFEAQDDTYTVLGCDNELEQVFTNLILNARDAVREIKPSGDIYVRLFKEKNYIKIEIQDEGIGIAQEIISNIFDPFFTTKSTGKGLGLGLCISQTIIQKYSGEIYVRSFPMTGTIFTIRFPRMESTKTQTSL